MLDRANAAWNEMCGWPRYDRETDNAEVLCPVGMGVITDNIISSCGLLVLLYFFPRSLPRSLKVHWELLLLFFSLTFSIYCTVARNGMQILSEIYNTEKKSISPLSYIYAFFTPKIARWLNKFHTTNKGNMSKYKKKKFLSYFVYELFKRIWS